MDNPFLKPDRSGVAERARPFSVGLFCGSRPGRNPAHAEAARELGEAIGRRRWRLVYGGGDVGLMGTTARAALAAGAEVLGIIPQRLLEREAGKRDITRLQVTRTMFERKELMIAGSDAFVVLPGGLGTLDEILDAVTLRQLGYHDKPVLLVDIDGYWARCRALFEHVIAEGFAEPGTMALLEVVPDVVTCGLRLEAACREQERQGALG